MHIEITTRHGSLEPGQQTYLNDKAQKLLKYFGRLMSIEVEVDHRKHDCLVEIFVSAEHKHDFVAREAHRHFDRPCFAAIAHTQCDAVEPCHRLAQRTGRQQTSIAEAAFAVDHADFHIALQPVVLQAVVGDGLVVGDAVDHVAGYTRSVSVRF